MEYRLFDMHCHLDFLPNAAGFARTAGENGAAFYSNTVEPAGYLQAREALAGLPNVRVGVGLHPWWVDDGRCGPEEVEQACQLASTTPYIGEVGLDLGKRHVASRDAQVAAFRRVATVCAREGGKLISIHSVKAGHAVLDILEETGCLRGNRVVMHWFSDSDDALRRAIALGCWFSVGPRMLATKRGRQYVRLIPLEKLLLETDLPETPRSGITPAEWVGALEEAARTLAEIRQQPLTPTLTATSQELLAL